LSVCEFFSACLSFSSFSVFLYMFLWTSCLIQINEMKMKWKLRKINSIHSPYANNTLVNEITDYTVYKMLNFTMLSDKNIFSYVLFAHLLLLLEYSVLIDSMYSKLSTGNSLIIK